MNWSPWWEVPWQQWGPPQALMLALTTVGVIEAARMVTALIDGVVRAVKKKGLGRE